MEGGAEPFAHHCQTCGTITTWGHQTHWLQPAANLLGGAMRAVGALFGRTNAPASVEPVPLIQEAEDDDGLTVEERLQIEVAEAAWDNVAIGRMLQARAIAAGLADDDPTLTREAIGASILDSIPKDRREALLARAVSISDEERKAMAREIREREFPAG